MKNKAHEILSLYAATDFRSAASLLTGIQPEKLRQTFLKDSEKIQAFLNACLLKIVEQVQLMSNQMYSPSLKDANFSISNIQEFANDFSLLVKQYAEVTESLTKFQFPIDLFRPSKFKNPYKKCIELAKELNTKWDLGVTL